MTKILEKLGLKMDATEEEAVKAIETLQAGQAVRASTSERERKIQAKMVAGLSREVAIEAIENQEREDKAAKSK